jgi:non-specific serine/threonine protein kinase/serine/threonine-protein kinase
MSTSSAAEEILLSALAKGTAEERAAYLDEACKDDPDLRRRVQGLLEAHLLTSTEQQKPALHSVATVGQAPTGAEDQAEPARLTPPTEAAGSRIGPYKLLQKLGEGGMGVVYLAEQEHPVKRRVALKIIKAGMDSAQVVARFEAERQALALMDHPNIAKVLDAGTIGGSGSRQTSGPAGTLASSATGRPFFVMELVKGIPITKYCDENHLTPRERLELVIPVCQAVQHAHTKGIIHRDLKPSNVLVALCDGRPVPKVIDFGVAKATSQKLTERTMFTEVGQIVGTLEYMAPEQAEPNNLDIDTRSDIYSLGVLLYELLTGVPPFTGQQLRRAGYSEMLRIIKEVEPPRPSTRLSGSAELLSIAAKRKLEPKRLAKLMHGELDWIVMKCLEKERQRRYETANGLAMDLQRYLADEPVQAGPPGAAYRLRKFVRKHRGAVAAAAAVLLALVAGLLAATLMYLQADAAQKLAEQRRLEAEEAHKQSSQAAATAEAINNFLVNDLLAEAAPERNPVGSKMTVREALDKAARTIDTAFPHRLELEAPIRRTLGRTYISLGLNAEAEPHLRKALSLFQQTAGAEHRETLNVMNALVWALHQSGKRDEADNLCRECLQTCQRVLGPDHQETLSALVNSADLLSLGGNHAEAERVYRRVLEARQRILGAEHRDTLATMTGLAVELYWQARYHEAESLHRRIVEACVRAHGPEHPHTLVAQHNLVVVLEAQGNVSDGARLAEETLAARRRVMGDSHWHTLSSMNALAGLRRQQGRQSEAAKLYREILAISRGTLGLDHSLTLLVMHNLALVLDVQGRFADAEPLFRQTLEVRRRVSGEEHPLTLGTLYGLANTLYKQNRLAEAEPLYRQVLEVRRRVSGEEHPDTLLVMNGLGWFLLHAGKRAEAELLCRAALEGRRKKLPPGHRSLALSLVLLGQLHLEAGQPSEAEPLLREALAIQEKAPREGDWEAANARSLLGGCLSVQGRHAEAEPLLVQGYEGLKKDGDNTPAAYAAGTPGSRRLSGALERLVQLYDAWGKKDEAARWRKELEASKAPKQKPTP